MTKCVEYLAADILIGLSGPERVSTACKTLASQAVNPGWVPDLCDPLSPGVPGVIPLSTEAGIGA